MVVSLLRRRIGVPSFTTKNFMILRWFCNFCSESSTIPDNNNKESNPSNQSTTINPVNHSIASHVSPFLQYSHSSHKDDFNVELVDPDLWRVSSSLAQSWRGTTSETECSIAERIDEMDNYSTPVENEAEADFDDDIQDMRIRGKLFYKIDRDSREYEEYNFDFHRKKSSKKNNKEKKESKKKEKSKLDSSSRDENLAKVTNKNLGSKLSPPLEEMNNSYQVKKLRKPSYNQLTGPYHEPFCLDLYISKSSVRACVVHRVTSKVVAVAHSISKDMKFDLSSTRDSTACVAVGAALAQRALADDIHDVIYTPRKGEKLEGKRLIVLQSVIDHGIKVKVKIKQRNMSKKLPTLPFK